LRHDRLKPVLLSMLLVAHSDWLHAKHGILPFLLGSRWLLVRAIASCDAVLLSMLLVAHSVVPRHIARLLGADDLGLVFADHAALD